MGPLVGLAARAIVPIATNVLGHLLGSQQQVPRVPAGLGNLLA